MDSAENQDDLAGLPSPIVFFDGGCALCNRTVRWLLRRDRKGRLHYAPLQGETADRIRRASKSLPDGVETVVLAEIEGEKIHIRLRSRAVLRMTSYLGRPWSLLGAFRVLPSFLTDLGYRAIARLRHQLSRGLGPVEAPSEELRSRFLP